MQGRLSRTVPRLVLKTTVDGGQTAVTIETHNNHVQIKLRCGDKNSGKQVVAGKNNSILNCGS